MTCPICGGDTLVTHSVSDCEGVYRKRTCKECGHIFNTSELESDGSMYNELTRTAARERSRRRAAKRKEVKQ